MGTSLPIVSWNWIPPSFSRCPPLYLFNFLIGRRLLGAPPRLLISSVSFRWYVLSQCLAQRFFKAKKVNQFSPLHSRYVCWLRYRVSFAFSFWLLSAFLWRPLLSQRLRESRCQSDFWLLGTRGGAISSRRVKELIVELFLKLIKIIWIISHPAGHFWTSSFYNLDFGN